MKKLIFLIIVSFIFHSCDSSTSPQRNPIGYLSEDAYFITEPFISYPNIKNRIDIAQIHYPNTSENDSNFFRAMFYDNSVLFKNAGDIFVNDMLIEKRRADKILKIKVLFEDIINFGPGYYSELSPEYLDDSIKIEATGSDEIESFSYNIIPVTDIISISNLNEISVINIKEGFNVNIDTLSYENYRVNIYNNKTNRATYFQNPTQSELFVPSERLIGLSSGNYTLEITGGKYLLDTLNDNYLIINNFKSSRYQVELK